MSERNAPSHRAHIFQTSLRRQFVLSHARPSSERGPRTTHTHTTQTGLAVGVPQTTTTTTAAATLYRYAVLYDVYIVYYMGIALRSYIQCMASSHRMRHSRPLPHSVSLLPTNNNPRNPLLPRTIYKYHPASCPASFTISAFFTYKLRECASACVRFVCRSNTRRVCARVVVSYGFCTHQPEVNFHAYHTYTISHHFVHCVVRLPAPLLDNSIHVAHLYAYYFSVCVCVHVYMLRMCG